MEVLKHPDFKTDTVKKGCSSYYQTLFGPADKSGLINSDYSPDPCFSLCLRDITVKKICEA